jgi:rhodanese-related sulfurtransferase
MERVDGGELLRRVRQGKVTLLDVRPLEEFRAGHIPRALPVPLPELKKRLATAPKNRDVVASCRGPYCVLAVAAVALLRKRGFSAHRLEQGIAEWRVRGGRVETSKGTAAVDTKEDYRWPGRPSSRMIRRTAAASAITAVCVLPVPCWRAKERESRCSRLGMRPAARKPAGRFHRATMTR